MRHTLNNINSAVDKLAKAPKEVAFAMQKVNVMDDDTARVAIQIPATSQAHISEEAMAKAVAHNLPGLRYLPNSVHRISTTDKSLFGVFVTKTKASVSMEQASAADSGFTKVSDTVFQDENDAIWTVVGDGEAAFLSAQVGENIAELLGAVKRRAIATASQGVELATDYSPTEYVVYYDLDKQEIASGVAVDGAHIYDIDKEVIKEVEPEQVLAVDDSLVRTDVANEIAALRSAGGADKKALLAYLQKLYGQDKAYFAKIKDIVNNYVAV